jgi:hypothetical protein
MQDYDQEKVALIYEIIEQLCSSIDLEINYYSDDNVMLALFFSDPKVM